MVARDGKFFLSILIENELDLWAKCNFGLFTFVMKYMQYFMESI